MENTISNRILEIMSTYSLNKNSFSMAIGLTNNVTIGRIINENRRPSQKTLQMILTKFSNIDANWLFSGVGEMYKSDFDEKAESILRGSLIQMDESKFVGSSSKKMSVQMSGDSQKMSVHSVGSQNKDGDLSLTEIIRSQLVELLLSETKELNQEIGALKHENTQLKAENAQLHGDVEDLKNQLAKAV